MIRKRELVLAFLLFLGIVMLGIRKTIHYIRKLSQEIKILEGGDLNYPITVMGKDELAQLAEGLDSMRQSFLRQTEHGNIKKKSDFSKCRTGNFV